MEGFLVRLKRSALLAFSVVGIVVAAAAPSAMAKAPTGQIALTSTQACAVSASSPLFAAWGDENLYSPFAGGTFEVGTSGWSNDGGAGIVSGDDDHSLTTAGTHAMQIPGKATASSPTMCVDSTMPSMRFFIRRTSGSGNLTIIGTLGDDKHAVIATLATLTATTSWAPTPPIVFPTSLAALVGTGSLNVQFQFVSDPGTTFRIDDVAMDPYRRT
jgi:hypothetical protein